MQVMHDGKPIKIPLAGDHSLGQLDNSLLSASDPRKSSGLDNSLIQFQKRQSDASESGFVPPGLVNKPTMLSQIS